MVSGSLFLSTQAVKADYLPHSATGSTAAVYDAGGDPLGGLIRFWSGKLSSGDRNLHVRTILMALNNADNGEEAVWYSRTSPSYGKIRIVYTYDAGAGYCRVFQSLVNNDGDIRQYQETQGDRAGREYLVFELA